MDVYPNPFNDIVTINYQIPESMQVSIKLYSILGQEVAEIVSPESFQMEGSHSLNFNTNNLSISQGLYFIELKTKDVSKTTKLIRAKSN